MSLEVNMSNQNKQKRPKYTIEFKQDAAKLVNEKGYTHKQAADNLGITLQSFQRQPAPDWSLSDQHRQWPHLLPAG